MRIPVTVMVMSKNEEKCIEKCLSCLSDFERVLLIDSNSTDGTLDIAKRFKNTETIRFTWNGQFPKKRQWCLENIPVHHEWILFIDADEEMTPQLAAEIAKKTQDPSMDGYFVGFDYYFVGSRLRYGNPPVKLVLFRTGRARFLAENEILVKTMYEVEGTYQPVVDGKVGYLKSRAVHHDLKPLFYWLERHNRYSDMDAFQRLFLPKVRENYPPLRRVMKWISGNIPASSLLYFFYTYFIRLGFLDGLPGLAFAIARTSYLMQIEIKILEMKRVPEIVESHYRKASRPGIFIKKEAGKQ